MSNKSGGKKQAQLGDAVLLSKGIGMVRYFGSLPGFEGEGYGIELVTPDGNCDGTWKGKRFFRCKPEYGLFVATSKIKRRITPQELLNKIGLLNKKMKTLVANSDPSQNPQIQMKLQESREAYETEHRRLKKVQAKLIEFGKSNKQLKKQVEELTKKCKHLQAAVNDATLAARQAMDEKSGATEYARQMEARFSQLESDMREIQEKADESDDDSQLTLESALEEDMPGSHVRITTEEQLRQDQEFTVSIDERPTGIRFGHEDEGQTLVVHSVTRGKLGERVGIRPGDIVLSINGELITDSDQALQNYRTVTLPLELRILRTQTQVANEFEVSIDKRPAGIKFKHEDNGGTLMVNEVEEGKRGYELGIRPGDIIVMIQQESVPDSETMLALYREASVPFILRLYRNKSNTSFVVPLPKEDISSVILPSLSYSPNSFPSLNSNIRDFLQSGDELRKINAKALYGSSKGEIQDVVNRIKDDKVHVQVERRIKSFTCNTEVRVTRAFNRESRQLSSLNEGTVVNISEIRDARGKLVYPLCGWIDLSDDSGNKTVSPFTTNNPGDALGVFAQEQLGINISESAIDDIMHFAALLPHQDFVCSVQWSPVEDVCASGASDNTMRLWRIRNNRGIVSASCYAEFMCKECVYCIGFSPDGRYLAAALYDNTVEVREVATGRLEAVLGEHDYFVWQVRFTPDGKTLVSSAGKYVYIWQTEPKWKLMARLQADGGGVWGVGLSPDGKYVATSGNDNTVKIWKLDTCDFVASLIGHTRRPMCVVFTFDGRFLISGGDDRQIRIWGVQDGKCRAVLAGHQDNVRALAVTHDGLLASASDDNTIKLWNLQTGHCIRTMIGHQDAVRDVAFSRTGQYLCSGSNDNTMRVWAI